MGYSVPDQKQFEKKPKPKSTPNRKPMAKKGSSTPLDKKGWIAMSGAKKEPGLSSTDTSTRKVFILKTTWGVITKMEQAAAALGQEIGEWAETHLILCATKDIEEFNKELE